MSISYINLVDSLDTVREDGRVSRNQIKMKSSTYEAVSSAWRKFRLSLLDKKLDRMKDDFVHGGVTLGLDYRVSPFVEAKIARKSNAIARLEQKIMLLSGKDVPLHYLQNRALKLRSNMMSNLRYNLKGYYAVEAGKEDEVLRNDLIQNTAGDVDNSLDDTQEIDVRKIANANQGQIANDVNAAMNSDVEESQPIDKNTIDEVINSYADKIQLPTEVVSDENVHVAEDSPMTQEIVHVPGEVNVFTENNDLTNGIENEIESDLSENVVNNEQFVPPVIPDVSEDEKSVEEEKNISEEEVPKTFAPLEPLTDEQIAEMREDLNKNFADSYRQSIGLDGAVREEVVVTPERTEQESTYVDEMHVEPKEEVADNFVESSESNKKDDEVKEYAPLNPLTDEQIAAMREDLNKNFADNYRQSIGLDKEQDSVTDDKVSEDDEIESYSFNEPVREERNKAEDSIDYSNASSKDIENAVNVASTIADLEAIKRRVEESHRRAEAAERRQRETRERLQQIEEAKRAREEEERRAEEGLQKMIAELNQRIMANDTYSDAVEDDCEYNESKTKEVEAEEQEASRRIAEKRAQAEELGALLGTFTADNEDNKSKGR